MRLRMPRRMRPTGSGVSLNFRFLRYSSSGIELLEFLPRSVERSAAPPEIRPGIADFLQPLKHVPYRDAIGPKVSSTEFLPFKRDRYGSAAARPHGIGRSHRLRIGVSVGVHEHASAAPVFPLFQRPLPGLPAHDYLCVLRRKSAHGIKRLSAFERHGHVKTARTGRLEVRG